MPVIATPVTSPGLEARRTGRPLTSRIFDRPVPTKMRGLTYNQGQSGATLEYVLFDNEFGNVVDLAACGIEATPGLTTEQVKLRIREAVGLPSSTSSEINGTVVDPEAGLVSFALDETLDGLPGVYNAEIGVLDLAGKVVFTNAFYLLINRGLFGTVTQNGPPTLQEIRLMLRDEPEYNRLFDDVFHDVADICEGIVQAVMYWNAAPPELGYYYDTTSFPTSFRHFWLHGITAHLYMVAAGFYRRNRQQVQAGGVALDDLGKARDYEQASEYHRQLWADWVKKNKLITNISGGFGISGSGYGASGSW